MITILVGHRGVGKTSLLQRIASYVPRSLCFCLDTEIEIHHGSIKNIFQQKGEAGFRQIENEMFQKLLKENSGLSNSVYIVVGGGFRGDLPKEARVLWITRDWDVSKNIFFDRPSLNSDPQDLRIPMELFLERAEKWEKNGYEILTLPEGAYRSHPGEKAYFHEQAMQGDITLLPAHFVGQRLQALQKLKPTHVELRDDLLTPQQMAQAVSTFAPEQILLSFRSQEFEKNTASYKNRAALIDWPVERGEPHLALPREKLFSSYHSEEDNYFDALEFVEGFSGGRIKWSPFVKNLLQLRLGHEWQKRDPAHRVFLPRSENGKWYWYRHLQKQKIFVNFLRTDLGSSLDQPTLLQWLQPQSQNFAAVLGQPVLQSWSPSYHADFFAQRNTAMYSIEVEESDLLDGGFDFLTSLGMKWVAVTSPLKSWAGRLVGAPQPINTLVNKSQQWQGTSTDETGFEYLQKKNRLNLAELKVALWGGGGVLSSLNLPHALAYSARTGLPREGEPLLKQIDALVWAAGWQSIELLPSEWRPQTVVDLNYRADSPARAYAHKVGAQYISGEDMFFKQADEQQKIWSSYE